MLVQCFVVLSSCAVIVKEKASCFTLFVFLVHCEFYVAFPRGVVCWSAVCDCGISWSYSLAFCIVDTGLDMNNTRR